MQMIITQHFLVFYNKWQFISQFTCGYDSQAYILENICTFDQGCVCAMTAYNERKIDSRPEKFVIKLDL